MFTMLVVTGHHDDWSLAADADFVDHLFSDQ